MRIHPVALRASMALALGGALLLATLVQVSRAVTLWGTAPPTLSCACPIESVSRLPAPSPWQLLMLPALLAAIPGSLAIGVDLLDRTTSSRNRFVLAASAMLAGASGAMMVLFLQSVLWGVPWSPTWGWPWYVLHGFSLAELLALSADLLAIPASMLLAGAIILWSVRSEKPRRTTRASGG